MSRQEFDCCEQPVADGHSADCPFAKQRSCWCCGAPVRIMTETDYCSAKCRRGKCGHKGEVLSLGARMGHPGGHYGQGG